MTFKKSKSVGLALKQKWKLINYADIKLDGAS